MVRHTKDWPEQAKVIKKMVCPKCGKPMQEELNFVGLWTCPDSKIRLNNEPPFKFKCDGLELTDEGAEAFDDVLRDVALQKYFNVTRN